MGDGNNMANSLLVGCTKLGMDVAVACPSSYQPDPRFVAWARENAVQTGCTVTITDDPREAVENADCIYSDVWASMGQEEEALERMKVFAGKYCASNSLLEGRAKPDYIYMHCLPAHRGEEVLPEVIDGPHSVIFDEAENRLHAQKGVMALLMGKEEA